MRARSDEPKIPKRAEPARGREPRFERQARQRRERAREHLARKRDPALPRPLPRGIAAAVLAVSVLAGAAFARPVANAAGAFVRGAPLELETVHVRGGKRLTNAEIAGSTGIAPGAPFASVEPGAVVDALRGNAWVAEARVARLPSGALLVEIVERVPRAVLETNDIPPRLLDDEGRPFAPAEPVDLERLPRVAIGAPAETGAPHPELARATALADALPALGLARPTRVRVMPEGDPEGFVLELPGFAPPIVLGRVDPAARLSDLARLLSLAGPEVVAASSIDLRFADQAVLREAPSPETGTATTAVPRGVATPSVRGPAG